MPMSWFSSEVRAERKQQKQALKHEKQQRILASQPVLVEPAGRFIALGDDAPDDTVVVTEDDAAYDRRGAPSVPPESQETELARLRFGMSTDSARATLVASWAKGTTVGAGEYALGQIDLILTETHLRGAVRGVKSPVLEYPNIFDYNYALPFLIPLKDVTHITGNKMALGIFTEGCGIVSDWLVACKPNWTSGDKLSTQQAVAILIPLIARAQLTHEDPARRARAESLIEAADVPSFATSEESSMWFGAEA